MTNISDAYRALRLAELRDACNQRDDAAAAAVVERIRDDGYGDWASEVLAHLVKHGLERLAGARTGHA